MTWTTTFETGVGIALIGPRHWFLAKGEYTPADFRQAWQDVEAGEPASVVLATLLDGESPRLPDFVLVQREDADVRVFVRGTAQAHVDDQVIASPEAQTWAELLVPGAQELLLAFDDVAPTPHAWPCTQGMFPAAGLRITSRDAPVAPQPVSPPELTVGQDLAKAREAAAPAPVPTSELRGATELPDPADDFVTPAGPMPTPSLPLIGSPTSAASDDKTEDGGYDSLFGATVFRTVEAAAVRTDDPDGPDAQDARRPPDAQDAVPAPTAIAPAPAPPVTEAHTVTRSAIEAAAPASPNRRDNSDADGDSEGQPRVPAKRCVNAHLNAPHAYLCRVCSTPDFLGNVIEVVRPSLGALEFSTGQSVQVDRPVFIGRSPTAAMLGDQVPALVALANPDVSRSHLEVRLEGWTVLVVDLNSSNGTVVTAPGKSPRRLRPNEPMQITPGTEVEVAEAITFKFKVDQ